MITNDLQMYLTEQKETCSHGKQIGRKEIVWPEKKTVWTKKMIELEKKTALGDDQFTPNYFLNTVVCGLVF